MPAVTDYRILSILEIAEGAFHGSLSFEWQALRRVSMSRHFHG